MRIETDITINGILFKTECEISYFISGGQEGIFHLVPDDCQPAFAPDVEIELEEAFFLNSYGHEVKINGAYWKEIEYFLENDSETIDKVLSYETEMQEGTF